MYDINKLTMGEIDTIERLSNQSVSTIGKDTTPKAKFVAALAMVVKRREGFPEFTWNDAQALTFEEAQAVVGMGEDQDDELEDDEDPTQP